MMLSGNQFLTIFGSLSLITCGVPAGPALQEANVQVQARSEADSQPTQPAEKYSAAPVQNQPAHTEAPEAYSAPAAHTQAPEAYSAPAAHTQAPEAYSAPAAHTQPQTQEVHSSPPARENEAARTSPAAYTQAQAAYTSPQPEHTSQAPHYSQASRPQESQYASQAVHTSEAQYPSQAFAHPLETTRVGQGSQASPYSRVSQASHEGQSSLANHPSQIEHSSEAGKITETYRGAQPSQTGPSDLRTNSIERASSAQRPYTSMAADVSQKAHSSGYAAQQTGVISLYNSRESATPLESGEATRSAIHTGFALSREVGLTGTQIATSRGYLDSTASGMNSALSAHTRETAASGTISNVGTASNEIASPTVSRVPYQGAQSSGERAITAPAATLGFQTSTPYNPRTTDFASSGKLSSKIGFSEASGSSSSSSTLIATSNKAFSSSGGAPSSTNAQSAEANTPTRSNLLSSGSGFVYQGSNSMTPTRTGFAELTSSGLASNMYTGSASQGPSASPTNSGEASAANGGSSSSPGSGSVSSTNSNSYSPTNANTYSATSDNSYSPTNSDSYSPTNSNSYSPTNTNSYSPTNSNSYSPTNTNSYSPTNSNSYSPTNSNSNSPTNTGSISGASNSPSPTTPTSSPTTLSPDVSNTAVPVSGYNTSLAAPSPSELATPSNINGSAYNCNCNDTKQELLNAGATPFDLAVATQELGQNFSQLSNGYAPGDGKSNGSYNVGPFKNNWYMVQKYCPEFANDSPTDPTPGERLNDPSNLGEAVQCQHDQIVGAGGYDNWFKGQRCGQSGMEGTSNQSLIDGYKQGVSSIYGWYGDQSHSNDDQLSSYDVPGVNDGDC